MKLIMKTIKVWFLVIAFSLTVVSCQSPPNHKENQSVDHNNTVKIVDSLIVKNIEIVQYIEDYMVSDSLNKMTKVYNLLVEERNFHVYLTIESISNYEILIGSYLPVGSFKVKDKLVIMSMRLNPVFRTTDSDKDNLTGLLRMSVDSTFFNNDHGPSTYDPPVWSMELFRDSISISHNGFSPDIPVGGLQVKAPKVKR